MMYKCHKFVCVFCCFCLNTILPGSGFIFTQSGVHLALYYFSVLILALFAVSWSGIIFLNSAIPYFMVSYLVFSLFCALHYLYDHFYHPPSKNSQCTPPTKLTIYSYKLVLLLLFIAVMFSLALYKQTLLGWQIFQIPSASMYPTLHIGDLVLADTRSSTLKNIKKSDVIIFTRPEKSSSFFYIKRVIAISEDKVRVTKSELWVNDVLHAKSLLSQPPQEKKVPKNHYFVLGDNSNRSIDSRHWGAVAEAGVIGKFISVINRSEIEWDQGHPQTF